MMYNLGYGSEQPYELRYTMSTCTSKSVLLGEHRLSLSFSLSLPKQSSAFVAS